jgi:glycosyltransferase involved in cell wall biosynthesis
MLKLLGWYPDRSQLDPLIGGSKQIEILQARAHPETLQLISRCEILVQPSRCEGMGRVVLEAMGAGIPVIGSDVGGIPHLLRDGESGFVVAGGDSDALEARMRQLLLDGELRKRLGARGYELAHLELNEQVYVERFTEMVEAAVQGKE